MKSSEFIESIRTYMVKFAMQTLHDLDKAEDIAQYAFVGALRNIDFARTENEIKDYLIKAVKLVLRDERRMAYATGTNIHGDRYRKIPVVSLHAPCGQDSQGRYDGPHELIDIIPYVDKNYTRLENVEIVNQIYSRLKPKELTCVKMLANGATVKEASATCGWSNAWTYELQKKVRTIHRDLVEKL